MEAYSHKKRSRRASKSMLFVGMLILLAMLLSACGSNTTTGGGGTPTPNLATPTVAPPSDLITPGTLTVGSDTTYPPQEYIDTATNQATGFDVDLITAIGQRMGLQTKVVTTSFDTIINSLVAKRFDVVISAVSVTPERQKKVDFVPYFNAGESLLVKIGNPSNIKSTADLCGQKVGVQNGTIEQTDLQTANTTCKNAGKAAASDKKIVATIHLRSAWRERREIGRLSAAAAGAPNVLIIVVDTLRADHVSAYGYSRQTSPNLDRLSHEGVLFENATSAAPLTLRCGSKLRASIRTSRSLRATRSRKGSPDTPSRVVWLPRHCSTATEA